MAKSSHTAPGLYVGLLSGTSADAAEAVLCEIRGAHHAVKLRLLAHVSLPFSKALRARILSEHSAQSVSALNFELGEVFAQAALLVLRAADVAPSRVAAIGSHGQTIVHAPPSRAKHPHTLQVGEGSVIAERTGCKVICDFRTRDVAAGGEGAPLVPYLDWALFRKKGAARVLLNIGGIANLSLVEEDLEQTCAFDTGPGNMVLDALARRASKGRLSCDLDGKLALRGQVLPGLLEELLRHPFLRRRPPKSAGREDFGESFAQALWKRHQRRPADLLATLTAFTAQSIALGVHRLRPRHPLEGVYVSGGGTRNPALMRMLASALGKTPVQPVDALGFPEGAKEAACFALLARAFLCATPSNVPAATGAVRPVVLGKMVP